MGDLKEKIMEELNCETVFTKRIAMITHVITVDSAIGILKLPI